MSLLVKQTIRITSINSRKETNASHNFTITITTNKHESPIRTKLIVLSIIITHSAQMIQLYNQESVCAIENAVTPITLGSKHIAVYKVKGNMRFRIPLLGGCIVDILNKGESDNPLRGAEEGVHIFSKHNNLLVPHLSDQATL